MGSGNSKPKYRSASISSNASIDGSDPDAARTEQQLQVVHKVVQSLENFDPASSKPVLVSICNDIAAVMQFPMVCGVQIKLFATQESKEIVVSTTDYKKKQWNKINMLCSGSTTMGTLTVAYRSTNNPTANQCPEDYLERLFVSDESTLLCSVSSILSTTLMLHRMQTKVAQEKDASGTTTGVHTTGDLESSQREGVQVSKKETKSDHNKKREFSLDAAADAAEDVVENFYHCATEVETNLLDLGGSPVSTGSKRSRSGSVNSVTWEMLH